MQTYEKNVADRKVLVKRLEELTGTKGKYTFAPRMAFLFNGCAVEKSGCLTVEDGFDMSVVETLIVEGLIKAGNGETAEEAEFALEATGSTEEPVQEATEEPVQEITEKLEQETMGEPAQETAEESAPAIPVQAVVEAPVRMRVETQADDEPAGEEPDATEEYEDRVDVPNPTDEADAMEAPGSESEESQAQDGLTISVPIDRHTPESLRRLLNLIYSRGNLISKSTGGRFHVDKELLTALDEAGMIYRTEDFVKKVEECGGLTGISFTDGKVNFTGFPFSFDTARTAAYQHLVSVINKHVLLQKRVQAKEVNDENEKYIFRIWLVRIGLDGDEYKETRKILLENLSGHTAFRTKADEQKWKERQAVKREELRAKKEAESGADE